MGRLISTTTTARLTHELDGDRISVGCGELPRHLLANGGAPRDGARSDEFSTGRPSERMTIEPEGHA